MVKYHCYLTFIKERMNMMIIDLVLMKKNDDVESFIKDNLEKEFYEPLISGAAIRVEDEVRQFVNVIKSSDYKDNFDLLIRKFDYKKEYNSKEKEKYHFKFDNFRKKYFTCFNYEARDYYNTGMLYKAFIILDEKEKKYRKPYYEFNKAQVEDSMISIYKNTDNGYQISKRIVKRVIVPFASEIIGSDLLHLWTSLLSRNEFDKLIKPYRPVYPSREDVYNLDKYLSDSMITAMAVMIFEGVCFSHRSLNKNEISHILESDLSDGKLYIRNREGEVTRYIDVDDKFADIINKSNKLTHVTYGKTNVVYEYIGKYIIKKSFKGKTAREKAREDAEPVSPVTLINRYAEVSDIAARLGLFDNLTPNELRWAGMIYYLEKYLDEGCELADALEKVMIRFNEVPNPNANANGKIEMLEKDRFIMKLRERIEFNK